MIRYSFEEWIDINSEFNINEYIDDLNLYFGSIEIPKYEDFPDKYYIEKGINVEELYFLLHKTPLERFKRYLLFAGWMFKQPLSKNDNVYKNAKLLLQIRKFKHKINRINIGIKTYEKEMYTSNDPILIETVEQYLNKFFNSFFNSVLSDDDFVTDRMIKNYIERFTKRRGAPLTSSRLAQFAELLVFLLYSSKDISYKIDKFSNEDCRLIHDYFVIMGILKVDRNKKNLKNIGAPDKYIRILIVNERKRRLKYKEKPRYLKY